MIGIGFISGAVGVYGEDLENISNFKLYSIQISMLRFSKSNSLFVAFKNGLVVVMEKDYSRARAILQDPWKILPNFIKFSICEVIESDDNLILACTMKTSTSLLIHRITKNESCRPVSFTSLNVEAEYEDFELHISGKYIIISLESRCICLYEIFSHTLVGVINRIGRLALDISGLYLAVLQGEDIKKLEIFEVGTGNMVSEMGRIANSTSMQWSCDGKLISLIGNDGKLEIWKVPQEITFNIENMIRRNEADVWERFPISYDNKSITKQISKKEMPNDGVISNIAFTDHVISLVSKPKIKEKITNLEIPKLYTQERIPSRIPEKEVSNNPFGPKISNLYIPSSPAESINMSLPPQRYSYVHKPQQEKQSLVLDPYASHVSNNPKVALDSPVVLTKSISHKDEPISFSNNLNKKKNYARETVDKYFKQVPNYGGNIFNK